MAQPQRNLLYILVPFAAVLAWFALGNGVFSRPAETDSPAANAEQPPADHWHAAAASILAAAKDRAPATKNDEEAIRQALWSSEALRYVGMLGNFDTSAETSQVFDAFRYGRRPMVSDAIIQLRLASALRQWEQLNDAGHAAAIENFVADVKKTGLTRGQAELMIRMSDALDDYQETKLIAKALNGVLPLARESSDPQLKRMAGLYEGILRRLDLAGNSIDLEGTLLDGTKLDWSTYRGKVVLIDFHASWCTNCRAEVPNILENYHAYHGKGFEVLGVNLDKERGRAEQYVQQTGFNFPVIIGDSPSTAGWDHPLARKYGITSIPRAILVDQDGKVVSTIARGERLSELLEQLLGPSDRPPTRVTGRIDDPSVYPAGQLPTDQSPAGKSSIVPASAVEESAAPEPAPDVSAAPEPPK